MTLEISMFLSVRPGSRWLLQPLTILLLLASADRQTDFPKAMVKLEPPWIQVLQEDYVTLKCQGIHNSGNHSTQWFHNRRLILTQPQSNYRFKAKKNDSGAYRCQMDQISLSDPVHLDVLSDWLLLQTTQLVFQEGDTIMLRCHSWKNNPLNKITFYQNGNSKQFSHFNNKFSIPLANQSHSGDYYCKGSVGRKSYSSKSVTITVQGPTIPYISLPWYQITFFLVMGLLFAVDTGMYFSVQRDLQSSVENRRNYKVRWCHGLQDK
ncbi:low affinity immunoglobulin gamma Fc region receptor II-a isoform X2 [Sciurus carolinensis]|uniref:low affinity immunoglobulin gamma Fc region receptor II-a isoform X2 n=1 Tax=Sciurus carolinensis TaxID=30640 RepID=UPI001FB21B2C|nr:low affinity immunoglobulin gamma Fc region receptor II-a isoform X2 [Sciurus carolinensis]